MKVMKEYYIRNERRNHDLFMDNISRLYSAKSEKQLMAYMKEKGLI